jgi:hypothetical protein
MDILKLLFKKDPVTYIGMFIVVISGVVGYSFSFAYDTNDSLILVAEPGFSLFGSMVMVVGIIILVIRAFNLMKKHSLLFYGHGLKNMNPKSPIGSIPFYNRPTAEPVLLKISDSYNRQEVIEFYNRYDSIVHERAFNSHVIKNYVAALGGFPYLFLIGSMFRDAYDTHIGIMDFDRTKNGGVWYELPTYRDDKELLTHELMYQENVSIDDEIARLKEFDEVAIALSYTFSIEKNTIEENLRDKTLYLKLSTGHGHDKLCDAESQGIVLKELSSYIAVLSGRDKKVHLYVSAQSSICINIGRTYMNNAHGNLILHNYDHKDEANNWSISFIKGVVS